MKDWPKNTHRLVKLEGESTGLRDGVMEGYIPYGTPVVGQSFYIQNHQPLTPGMDTRSTTTSRVVKHLPAESGPKHWVFITRSGTKYLLEEL